MRLPPFEILEPETLKDALSTLGNHKKNIKVIAGGTELVGLMKLGLLSPGCLMSLKKIKGLAGVRKLKRKIAIGSCTTVREIIESPIIREEFAGLVDASKLMAAPPIQNRATIGGNILQNSRCMYYNQSEIFRNGLKPCFKAGGKTCNAVKGGKRCFSVYQSDLAPALMSVSAQLKLEKNGSSRIVSMADIFSGKGVKPLSIDEDELLTEIVIPLKEEGIYSSTYEKLRIRNSLEYPLVSSAVFLSGNRDGTIKNACVVLGAVGPCPKIVEKASAVLKGARPTRKDIMNASAFVLETVEAVNNLPAPASYRRKMAEVCARRAISNAVDKLGRGGQL